MPLFSFNIWPLFNFILFPAFFPASHRVLWFHFNSWFWSAWLRWGASPRNLYCDSWIIQSIFSFFPKAILSLPLFHTLIEFSLSRMKILAFIVVFCAVLMPYRSSERYLHRFGELVIVLFVWGLLQIVNSFSACIRFGVIHSFAGFSIFRAYCLQRCDWFMALNL